MKTVTDENFAAETSKGLVLVDFSAEWCGPCKMLAPVFEELAGNFAGKVEFVKADVDEAPESADRFAVRSVPTLVLLKDGMVVGNRMGFSPKSVLEGWLESELTGA